MYRALVVLWAASPNPQTRRFLRDSFIVALIPLPLFVVSLPVRHKASDPIRVLVQRTELLSEGDSFEDEMELSGGDSSSNNGWICRRQQQRQEPSQQTSHQKRQQHGTCRSAASVQAGRKGARDQGRDERVER